MQRKQPLSPPKTRRRSSAGTWDGEDGHRRDAAPKDRLLRRGPVGAGHRDLVGGARPGDGRAGHVRLLRRGVPGPDPEQRAALFDGAARPLFALPVDTKRRNYYGADKPYHGYLGGLQGYDGYESLAIIDGNKPEPVRDFAGLMWPDGGSNDGFW